MHLTIDSFAWVELGRGSPRAANVRAWIERAEECWTPAIVLAEVAHVSRQHGVPEERLRALLRAIVEASHTVPIDPELAVEGSRATSELRVRARELRLSLPGLADGLVLATARRQNAQLLTGDPHFRGLSETLWVS